MRIGIDSGAAAFRRGFRVMAIALTVGMLTVGILLAPIVAAGHHHDGARQDAATCAICVLEHHTPASTTDGPTLVIASGWVVVSPPLTTRFVSQTILARPTGRAPPALAPIEFV